MIFLMKLSATLRRKKQALELICDMNVRQTLIFVLFCIVAMTLLTPLAVRAQSASGDPPCAPPGYRLDVRPNPSGPAIVVGFGSRVLDVVEINDVDQTITIDLAFRMRWTDARLADWEGCKLSIHDIWFPELALKNSGRMFQRWPKTVSVEKGGQVTYLQRASGTFASYHNLADFPFDNQMISLWVFPRDWSSSKVSFRADNNFSGVAPLLNISDWRISGVEASLSEAQILGFGPPRSRYVLQISAERYVSYYIWKIMLPITLIVVMSWSVFWINPKEFGTQMGLSATSVLTMIAFIFATTSLLPRLGYFTMLDRYIAGATVFVFVALLQSLITGYIASTGRVTFASRIDFVSRFAFPMTFVVLCTLFYADLV